jgi:hypothetical protein
MISGLNAPESNVNLATAQHQHFMHPYHYQQQQHANSQNPATSHNAATLQHPSAASAYFTRPSPTGKGL